MTDPVTGTGPPGGGIGEGNEVGSNPYREGDHNRNADADWAAVARIEAALAQNGVPPGTISSGEVQDFVDSMPTELLEVIESVTDNALFKFILGLVPVNWLGALSGALGWGAGEILDRQASRAENDFENIDWGGFDPANPSEFSQGYWDKLGISDPYDFTNPETGANLGEAGGMPGAAHNQGDLDALYDGRSPPPLSSQDWGSGWGGTSGGSGWYVLEGGAPGGGDLRLFCRSGHCKP